MVYQGNMSNNSLLSRYMRVSFVTWMSTVFSIVMQLVSVPICLHYWGDNVYGAWVALFAAFTIMRTIDGGYTTYIGNKLNILYHKSHEDLRVTLASAIWGCLLLGMLQLVILSILYITGSMNVILGAKSTALNNSEAFWGLLVLSVSWICTGSYIGVIHRLQNPAGMMYQAAWWGMGFQVFQFVCLIFAAISRMNIFQAACLFAFVQAFIYLSSAIYLRYKLADFYPWLAGSSVKVGLSNLIRCLPITGGGILQQGSNNAVIMLISSLLGSIAVSSFSTVRTLSNLWTNLINIFTSPLLPDLVRFYVNKDWHRFTAVLTAHSMLVNSLINFTIIVTYPFLNIIYLNWTGHHLQFNAQLLNYLLATVSITAATSLISAFLSGINHASFVIICSTVRGTFGIVLGYVLLKSVGIYGVALALFIGEFVILFITITVYFIPILRSNGCDKFCFFCNKSLLGSLTVICFLVFNSLSQNYFYLSYVISVFVIIVSVILSWQSIDMDMKIKLMNKLRLTKILRK